MSMSPVLCLGWPCAFHVLGWLPFHPWLLLTSCLLLPHILLAAHVFRGAWVPSLTSLLFRSSGSHAHVFCWARSLRPLPLRSGLLHAPLASPLPGMFVPSVPLWLLCIGPSALRKGCGFVLLSQPALLFCSVALRLPNPGFPLVGRLHYQWDIWT